MRLLHAAGDRGRLARSLRRELLARRLTASGLARRLLRARHCRLVLGKRERGCGAGAGAVLSGKVGRQGRGGEERGERADGGQVFYTATPGLRFCALVTRWPGS